MNSLKDRDKDLKYLKSRQMRKFHKNKNRLRNQNMKRIKY